MTEQINLDMEDTTVCGKFAVRFVLLLILSLTMIQYWDVLEPNAQVAIILGLLLLATIFYKKEIHDMVYT